MGVHSGILSSIRLFICLFSLSLVEMSGWRALAQSIPPLWGRKCERFRKGNRHLLLCILHLGTLSSQNRLTYFRIAGRFRLNRLLIKFSRQALTRFQSVLLPTTPGRWSLILDDWIEPGSGIVMHIANLANAIANWLRYGMGRRTWSNPAEQSKFTSLSSLDEWLSNSVDVHSNSILST